MTRRITVLIATACAIFCWTFSAQALEVGDVVWAQWKPNAWYHGKIEKECPVGFSVAFDDGDKADLPACLIVEDKAASEYKLKVGARVLAIWTDGKFYPGTIVNVTGEGKYNIRFDDQDSKTVAFDDLRFWGE